MNYPGFNTLQLYHREQELESKKSSDNSSIFYQQKSWESLKRNINTFVLSLNNENVIHRIKDILEINIVRGKGILCETIMKVQINAPENTVVYATFISIINSEFPEIGELILKKCIAQFRSAFIGKQNSVYLKTSLFISHLINYNVAKPIIAIDQLDYFLKFPNENSIEMALMIFKMCTYKLNKNNKKKVTEIIFEMQEMLEDKDINIKVKKGIHEILQLYEKNSKKNYTSSPNKTKLAHYVTIESFNNSIYLYDYFNIDNEFVINEKQYKRSVKSMLKSLITTEYDLSHAYDGDDEGEYEEDKNLEELKMTIFKESVQKILNVSINYQDCAHRLIKLIIKSNQEKELCNILMKNVINHTMYNENLGYVAQIICHSNKQIVESFENIFTINYTTLNLFNQRQLLNFAKLFAYLLSTDSISWNILSIIQLNEAENCPTSIEYIKNLFLEIIKNIGYDKLSTYVQNPSLKMAFEGIFQDKNEINSEFFIDFLTSIGLDGLIDEFKKILDIDPDLII